MVVISSGRPSVPDIKPGTTAEQADQALRDMQLEPGRGTEEYSPDVPQGAVLSVNPPPGTSLDLGSQVAVVLSKGPPPQPVPDVVGKSKDDAFNALRQAGFEPVQAGEEPSPDVGPGRVIRTDPAAGTTVTSGDKKINLWVSNAVEVPDVRYKSFDDAQNILLEAGLDPDISRERGHGGFDFVLQQSPDPGTKVPLGTKVQLRGLG
jgi:serine/threonine-protein kinase